MRRFAIVSTLLCVAACAAPFQKKEAPEPPPLPWSFDAAAPQLRAASCPEGVKYTRAETLPIQVNALDKGPVSAYADRLNGVRFAGAWELQAHNPSFGGLSGLAVLRSGSLLAISDAGAFIQIGIDPETDTPDGLGSISYMMDAKGRLLQGKRRADSEGLDFRDGLALVSFEHSHRVEAFDLENCGAAARAALVSTVPDRIEGRKIGDNRGAEALRLKGDMLQIGYEHRVSGYAHIASLQVDGSARIEERRLEKSSYLLTGSDYDAATDRSAYVYRWYLPGMGTRIYVEVDAPNEQRWFTIAAPMPVDNFEGIALAKTATGATRLWLISDDNFNPKDQRTLLFAFDL